MLIQLLISLAIVYSCHCRFDLMLGVNGQEGGLFYSFETALVAQALNKSIFEHGVDMEVVRESLRIKCLTQITPFSPNLCVDWIISTYKIDETDDDKERAARLVTFLGICAKIIKILINLR